MKTTPSAQKRQYAKVITAFAAILIVASVFFYSLTLQQAYGNFINYAESSIREHNTKGSVTFILIEALSVMISPFSSVPFLVVAIDVWGKTTALIYSIIGGLLGATMTYLIGYFALHRLFKKLIPIDEITDNHNGIAKKSPFWLVTLFILAMPVEIPGYALGIVKYPFRKYVLATLIGHFPFYVIAVFAGYAFIEKNIVSFVLMMILLFAMFCAALYYFYRSVKNK